MNGSVNLALRGQGLVLAPAGPGALGLVGQAVWGVAGDRCTELQTGGQMGSHVNLTAALAGGAVCTLYYRWGN